MGKINIKNLNLKELEEILTCWGLRPFHARQIFAWIYKKGANDFSLMSDLSSALRKKLAENFTLLDLKLVKKLKSKDGTEKFLFALKDKNLIEAVIIPAEGRVTGCVSTQVGCKFACRFCASGLLGFKRDLTCAEMIEEVLYAEWSNSSRYSSASRSSISEKDYIRDLKNNSQNGLTHLVFMGIGEPLDNYDNVLKAIRIINSKESLNMGARHITISTCGIIPGINKLANEDLQIELSVSLHAADDKTRSFIMPINKKYPLKELTAVCKKYIQKTNRQITFEYVLIKGINSDLESAKNLSKIVKDLNLCKVNLIPANFIKEYNIEPPNKLEILLFKDYLLQQNVNVTSRKARGQDIEAACGQLRLRYEKK